MIIFHLIKTKSNARKIFLYVYARAYVREQ